jgi:uncharacterized integral membrane protein
MNHFGNALDRIGGGLHEEAELEGLPLQEQRHLLVQRLLGRGSRAACARPAWISRPLSSPGDDEAIGIHGLEGWMRTLKLLTLLMASLLAIIVIAQNTDVLTVRFLAWDWEMSQIVLLGLVLAVGVTIGFVLGKWPSGGTPPQ